VRARLLCLASRSLFFVESSERFPIVIPSRRGEKIFLSLYLDLF
jgi:hypothetical protein